MPQDREQHRLYMREYRAKKRAKTAAARVAAADEQPSAAPATGRHARAVEAMLGATGLDRVAAEAPLVELVRSLAHDLDAGGELSTVAQYRAALAEMRRAIATPLRKPVAAPEAEAVSPTPEKSAPLNDLARFKAKRGIS